MIATTIREADPRPGKKRRRPYFELKVVVELQLPAWLQPQQRYSADPSRGLQEVARTMPNQEVSGSAFVLTEDGPQPPITMTGSADQYPDPLRRVSRPIPGILPPEDRPPAAVNGSDSLTFAQAFTQFVLPILQIEDKVSTIRGYQTAVKHFCDWFCLHKAPPETECAKNNLRSRGPKVVDVQKNPTWLAEFYSWSLGQGAEKTAANKLKAVKHIWNTLHSDGHMSRSAPEPRTKQIRKQCGVSKTKHMPIPASNDEIAAMLQAVLDLSEELNYPRIGDVPPYLFWFNVLAACAVHGFRPADLWPLNKKDGAGLVWSEVSLAPSPPIDGGEASRLRADWEFGWLNFRINKTGEQLLCPISPHLAFLIHQCRGLHPERVFPMGYSSKWWYLQIHRIRTRAGITRDVTLSGQVPSASFRKAASVRWKQHGGRAAASFMLGHSVRSGSTDDVDSDFSAVTEEHYMKADILREVVEAFPAVLASLPGLVRC